MTRTRLLTQYQTAVIVPVPRPARIARMYDTSDAYSVRTALDE